MAAIHNLLNQIEDPQLRERMSREWEVATRQKKFGLVYERHLPELLPLPKATPAKGDVVARRGNLDETWRVRRVADGHAELVKPRHSGPQESAGEVVRVALGELWVVKQFGDPIFPALTAVDAVRNGPDGAPGHTLIEADNYHALQLLEYLYAGRVDCIYIDPPYNTGARDWKYNNDYVDATDGWRHSKWLSFMEKRLRIAKRLLNPAQSVLMVTIDEKEYLRLGLLLEAVFSGSKIQMVSTLINPASVARAGAFGRSDEYIFFVTMGTAAPARLRLPREWVSGKGRTHTGTLRWDLLRRSGTNAERTHSPGCFYPIYVDANGPRVAEVGYPLPPGTSEPQPIAGLVPVLPIRKNRSEGNWQWSRQTFIERQRQGRVKITGSAHKGFVVSILKDGEYGKFLRGEYQELGRNPDGSIVVENGDSAFVRAVPGSQWRISAHDATQYGSRMLSNILPDAPFPFPKSLYAIRDAIRFFVEENPDALIVDFFAGSGTTLNAVNILNEADGGQRQCILVTNNEVALNEAAKLREEGYSPGDPEWEAQGICRSVTWPRSKYTILGRRDDGTELSGDYLAGRTIEIEKPRTFRHLTFVQAEDFRLPRILKGAPPARALREMATKQKALVAMIDSLPQNAVTEDCRFIVRDDDQAAILFDPAALGNWLEALEGQDQITEFYIVTETGSMRDRERQFATIKLQVEELLGSRVVTEEEKRPMAAGFAANLTYFKLDFLDKDQVELGEAFRDILPLLWLKAGAIGPAPELPPGPLPASFAPSGANFAVLITEARLGRFIKVLQGRTDLSVIFIITDAEEAFRALSDELRAALGPNNPELRMVQLYRDYLANFVINTRLDTDAIDGEGAQA